MGTTAFTVGVVWPTALRRRDGVISDGLTITVWPGGTPTVAGGPLEVTGLTFTFGATPLGIPTCTPPLTPPTPSEIAALPRAPLAAAPEAPAPAVPATPAAPHAAPVASPAAPAPAPATPAPPPTPSEIAALPRAPLAAAPEARAPAVPATPAVPHAAPVAPPAAPAPAPPAPPAPPRPPPPWAELNGSISEKNSATATFLDAAAMKNLQKSALIVINGINALQFHYFASRGPPSQYVATIGIGTGDRLLPLRVTSTP
jgi:hypothetical protein